MGKIVYLAWGSLYWDKGNLPVDGWKFSNLSLPLEFSRISDKGQGRMTLVIDTKNGRENRVWYGYAKTRNIDNAIRLLKKREKTVLKGIAYINLKSNKRRINYTPKEIVERIDNWAYSQEVDVVIWTDLPSNWMEIRKRVYSVSDAYNYFKNSELKIRLQILEYIYKAVHDANVTTNFSSYFFKKLAEKEK